MNNRIVYKNEYIDFNIEKALSIYNNASASGKTYLPYYVSRFIDFPTIIVISNKCAYDMFINNPWFAGKDFIYFFDRVDLFYSENLLEALRDWKDVCALIDVKGKCKLDFSDLDYRKVVIERKSVNFFEVRNGILF